MNNPYCASYEHTLSLFSDKQKQRTYLRLSHLLKKYTRTQIEEQLAQNKGEAVDGNIEDLRPEIHKNEFTEYLLALQLADFYFPNEDKQICFELKRGVDPESIRTYDDLIRSFDDHTHIDCAVTSANKVTSFQIKRYRGDNTHEAFIDWLNIKVLMAYGNMNKTSLIVLMQTDSVTGTMAMDKLFEKFQKEAQNNVTFDEVAVLYNDGKAGYLTLHYLYPKHRRVLISMDLALKRLKRLAGT